MLNKLITERTALALPSHARSLETYGRGLALFARIYYAFESAAYELSMSNKLNGKALFILNHLYVKGLRRSSRLESDLAHVCKVTGVDIRRTLQPYQDKMADRIRHELFANPHLLVAYTWVMYMAIFSGGRWIRKQLLDAGTGFWTGRDDLGDNEKDDSAAQRLPGFTFLSFDGDRDGQDIKIAFKAQLAAADRLLTAKEREEIVGAAQDIFDNCIVLVEVLDREIELQMAKKRQSRWLWLCVTAMILFLVLCYLTTRRV